MDIRRIPVDWINPATYKPRIDLQPGDPVYEKLKRSVEQFCYIDRMSGMKGPGTWSVAINDIKSL